MTHPYVANLESIKEQRCSRLGDTSAVRERVELLFHIRLIKLIKRLIPTLDESIDKYEEALKYVKICSETLAKAEQKVKILTESADGSISDRPFVYDEN